MAFREFRTFGSTEGESKEPCIVVVEREIRHLHDNMLSVARVIAKNGRADLMILRPRNGLSLFPESQDLEPEPAGRLRQLRYLLMSVGFATTLKGLFVVTALVGGLFFRGRRGMQEFVETGSFAGVQVGDAVYDSHIRRNLAFISPHRHPLGLAFSALKTYITVRRFKKILEGRNITGLCLTSLEQSGGRSMARCAVGAGIPVYVIGGARALLRVYRDPHTLDEAFYFVAPEDLDEVVMDTGWEKVIEEYLVKRTSSIQIHHPSGTPGTRDLDGAFVGKEILSAEDFSSQFVPPNRQLLPVVVIFAHCFSDAPHHAGPLLFLDYYDALIQTLNAVRLNDSVNWFVKPHPSRNFYGEARIAENAVIQAQSSNVLLWPEEVSTASALDWATGIITVNGTIGVEAACFGKPVLLGGNSAYGHLGFSKNPKTLGEYKAEIADAHNWQPLPEPQKILARKTIYRYHNLGNTGSFSGQRETGLERKIDSVLSGKVDKVCLL